ncbi:hypothetical protein SMD20_08335 [Nonomuraea sp. LP-02]|uniref:hypothetical protein n=1 Tax=Nonomuraea sp. LP-02 TaxID=3097960 RepID=UPI002E34983C|nr:hypothetical protein [Nonomuraea sp. LP-02]MED7924236.1 hypothetical protein [Nonomuraea sp. LP-02]
MGKGNRIRRQRRRLDQQHEPARTPPRTGAEDVTSSSEEFLTRLDAYLSEQPGSHDCGEGGAPAAATMPEVLAALADGRELRTRDLAAAVLAGRGCACAVRTEFSQALLDLLKSDGRVEGTLRRPSYWWRATPEA